MKFVDKIFKFMGQSIGFLLGVALRVEGVPCNPKAVAKDIGRIFDNGGADIKRDLLDMAMHMSPFSDGYDAMKQIYAVSKSVFDYFGFSTETMTKAFEEVRKMNRNVNPGVRSMLRYGRVRSLVKQQHIRPLFK